MPFMEEHPHSFASSRLPDVATAITRGGADLNNISSPGLAESWFGHAPDRASTPVRRPSVFPPIDDELADGWFR